MPTVEWNKCWGNDIVEFAKTNTEQKYGDHWGDPINQADLVKMKADHLLPFVSEDVVAMEIGSGGGRWTQYMLPFKHVYCVDINPQMFDYITARFGVKDNLTYLLTADYQVPEIKDESVDFCFSYGVLVHCDEDVIIGYLGEIERTLKKGGRAHLQFSDKNKRAAQVQDDYAEMTPERFVELLEDFSLDVDIMDIETSIHSSIVQLIKS